MTGLASLTRQALPERPILAPSPSIRPEGCVALDLVSQVIEAKFLHAGQVLEEAIDVVGELIGSLDQVAAALDADTVDNTTQGLTAAATHLVALSAAHQDRRVRLEDLGATGRALGEFIVEMRRSLSYVRVFAINIRITAGGIPEAGADFADFTSEIYASIEQGGRQLDEFSEELAGLAEQIDVALRHEVELERRCGDLLPPLRTRLENDASAIASHHGKMAAVAVEASGLARRVQQSVGGVIAALQVGDSTRQRIEHVQSALLMITPALNLEECAQARLADETKQLMALQLADTAQAFRCDVEHISESLEGIARDAVEIQRLRNHARSGEGSGDGDFLQRLEVSVEAAMNLVAEVHDAELAAREVGRSARAAAAGLESRVMSIRAIRADIQQMALNANLKCSRIGEAGRPLSVIAVEMRAYAGLLDEAAVGAEAVLRNLTGNPSKSVVGHAPQQVAAADIGRMLADAADRLRRAAAMAGTDLGDLAGRGAMLADTLGNARVGLSLQDEVGCVLEEAAQSLWARDAEAQDASDDPDFDAARNELMTKIAELYTMAREREIHRSIIADNSGRSLSHCA